MKALMVLAAATAGAVGGFAVGLHALERDDVNDYAVTYPLVGSTVGAIACAAAAAVIA